MRPKVVSVANSYPLSPASSSSSAKSTSAVKENGAAGGELDEVSRRKAELRLLTFYEAHVESVFSAQEPADFN